MEEFRQTTGTDAALIGVSGEVVILKKPFQLVVGVTNNDIVVEGEADTSQMVIGVTNEKVRLKRAGHLEPEEAEEAPASPESDEARMERLLAETAPEE